MSTGQHLEAQEAELAVLGAILLDNNALDRLSKPSVLKMHTPRHVTIFSTMMALAEAQEPIDTITIATVLERENQLETVGGMDYLLSLDQVSATAAHVDHREISS